MDELVLAIVISLWIATLLVLAIWVAFWKSRTKKRAISESEEELVSEKISLENKPAVVTKITSVQPIYKPYPTVTHEVGRDSTGK